MNRSLFHPHCFQEKRNWIKKSRYGLFIENIIQDALLFVFLLGVLSVFRGTFLFLFRDTLSAGTPWQDIGLTLWYGLRISLKTAGACVLPSFVIGTLLQTAWPKWNGTAWRLVWLCLVMGILSFLFQMRIPYYQEFHNAFGPFMFNTFHDDVGAIITTSIEQYQAVRRVLVGICCTVVLSGLGWCWIKTLSPKLEKPLQTVRCPWLVVILICIFLVPFAVFVRKGGSFTFNGSIYWKNAARMNQHILNEAVLDDIQAIYRARKIYKSLRKSSASVNESEVRAAAARLSGQPEYTSDDLLGLFSRTAPGSVGEKPEHIFVIVAETYMMWPLLDKYEQYPLADGMRRLLKRSDAVLVNHFLPASNGTMFGLTSVVLGIPELNLYAAARPTAQTPYETALHTQLKTLGYRTRFLYGGFSSWNDVGSFIKNQQFDEGLYASDFEGNTGVWGVPDRDFLQGVSKFITSEPSFNVILTSSNHPPYRVDMSREPDLPTVENLASMLPAQTADKDLVASRMWHFAYADKYLAEFVEAMLAKYPNSLFVITGDHADRWTMQASPSDYERIAVPLILIGPQVHKQAWPQQTAGSHMDIAATVLELVLPSGASYYALGKNLFAPAENQIPVGVSAYNWITPSEVGRMQENSTELLPGASAALSDTERETVLQRVKDIRTVAAWRVLKGIKLNGEK
ncbi:MAG: sulfatase-like hydrolase/transferase [Elusimicrobiaceae bacterium]|nr:sulfatase-like hydrolase/transferase [Elusimicrobiaceae bacterium]